MEVANPQRMGDGVSLVNPTASRSDDNPSAPHTLRLYQHSTSSFHRGNEPAKVNRHQPTSPSFTLQNNRRQCRKPRRQITLARQERVMGIEPTWPAWKAGTLPLSYTRVSTTNAIIKWREQDSNLRRHCHQIYSLAPLATRVSRLNQNETRIPSPIYLTKNRRKPFTDKS